MDISSDIPAKSHAGRLGHGYERENLGDKLTSIEEGVDASIEQLEDYIEKHGERLITANGSNTDDMRISRPEITKKQK